MRVELAASVASGLVRCARGGECKFAELVDGVLVGGLIRRGERWELDHADDGVGYLGASHAVCNARAGAASTNRGLA